MSIDEFDTPPLLAAKLLQVADMLCESEPGTVADFAVGTGELLAAAKLRWPQAVFFGCDISNDRVRRLTHSRTDWTVARCDFLDRASRSSLSQLENVKTKVDLALLNPPFSARGGTRVEVQLDGQDLRCSPAMAFVVLASQYLSPDGKLVALLPAGALQAERDQGARAALRQLGEFGAIPGATAKFPGGSLKVTIAYLKRGDPTPSDGNSIVPNFDAEQPIIRVLRGTLQTHELPTNGVGETIPLVHSTELQGYRLQVAQREVPSRTRSLSGPAVLLHRVGLPRRDKIVYVPQIPPFAITDCVVALLWSNEHECLRLHRSLTEHFDLLERNYIGSGAPYITIRRIQRVLQSLGFASEVIGWQESTPTTWKLGAHALDCGCRPCETVRQVVRKVLQAAGEPVLLPDRHIEDCAGPGCGASCGCVLDLPSQPSTCAKEIRGPLTRI